ncbi:MAG: hypothetical protein J7605_02610 [Variovorax sp.]|nr:hypothetical protein [Variovorax sp.]
MSQKDGSTVFAWLSWRSIRDIAVIALLVVLTWKLVNADISINIGEFSFTDLLALILALFSVWLSILFYFKADEASAKFYDNTYKFTKDMSEILGRIEAGFGERLRHLDEGQTSLRDLVGRFPISGAHVVEEVEREERVIEEKEGEQKKIIEELAVKAKLAEGEKADLFRRLAQTSEELELARAELRRLMEVSEADGELTSSARIAGLRVLEDLLVRLAGSVGPNRVRNMYKRNANEVWTQLTSRAVARTEFEMLKDGGVVDDHGRLTPFGTAGLRTLLVKHATTTRPLESSSTT